MVDRREPAHPEDAARWAALTGPIAPEAIEWAQKLFAADDEVLRAS